MKIVFLGDSVTEGCFELYQKGSGFDTIRDPGFCYASILGRMFQEAYPGKTVTVRRMSSLAQPEPTENAAETGGAWLELVNAGISGNTAEDGLRRLERDVISESPDIAVVCFGLNGATVTPEEYGATMEAIFRQLKEHAIRPVFLTPNMMNTYMKPDLPDYLIDAAQKCMNRQVSGELDRRMAAGAEAARKQGVPVCDVYALWKRMASYGVDTTSLLVNAINHPTREAHRLFADALFPMLNDMLSAAAVSRSVE